MSNILTLQCNMIWTTMVSMIYMRARLVCVNANSGLSFTNFQSGFHRLDKAPDFCPKLLHFILQSNLNYLNVHHQHQGCLELGSYSKGLSLSNMKVSELRHANTSSVGVLSLYNILLSFTINHYPHKLKAKAFTPPS